MRFVYCFFLIIFFVEISFSQETLPINQDYLSDNVYLVHPAAAGVGETGKIRVAIRLEGFGAANSPQLQTLNLHGKFKEDSKAAFGIILVNNKSNLSYTSRLLQATYAYHLDLDQTTNFSQLSFGFSFNGVFTDVNSQNIFDGVSVSQITQPIYHLNIDFGAAYHFRGLSSYLTIKNIYSNSGSQLSSNFDDIGVRNYVLGLGYFFGDESKVQYEPSVLIQRKETGENVLDVNFKAYKNLTNGQVWGGLSYRKPSEDVFLSDLEAISFLVGVNFNKTMFSYTYTKQLGDVVISGPFHQISIGFNVLPAALKLPGNPNINGRLF